jgi:hypothetical protein
MNNCNYFQTGKTHCFLCHGTYEHTHFCGHTQNPTPCSMENPICKEWYDEHKNMGGQTSSYTYCPHCGKLL